MADSPLTEVQNQPREVISACIDWNRVEQLRAERDANDRYVTVPKHAVRRVGALKFQLTPDEYREQRRRDAIRYVNNCSWLEQFA